METTGWLTLAAVLVALGIGIFSFIQTNKLKKAEKRERLLNEIIEWAIDVIRCGLEKDLSDLSSVTDMNEGKTRLAIGVNMLALSFQSMRGRNQYIHDITSAFGEVLQESADTLIKDLEEHIKLLDNLRYISIVKFTSVTKENMAEYMSEANESSIRIANQKIKIDGLAVKVIEEAVKIKIKDIG